MGEWKPWFGGEQPVADDVRVAVVERGFRSEHTEHPDVLAAAAVDWSWDHVNSDIIAYRVVDDAPLERHTKPHSADLVVTHYHPTVRHIKADSASVRLMHDGACEVALEVGGRWFTITSESTITIEEQEGAHACR